MHKKIELELKHKNTRSGNYRKTRMSPINGYILRIVKLSFFFKSQNISDKTFVEV